MFAVLKKELKSYLLTPIGYVFIGLFLLLFSFLFFTSIYGAKVLNYEYLFYDGSTILTFVLPVITMGMFAEERKQGTEQLILTSPRSITGIVLGKFLSATVIMVITEVLLLVYYVILTFFGNPSLAVALNTLFGFLILTMGYIAFGMFASSLTDSQIVAYIASVVFFMAMWILPYAGIPIVSNFMAEVSLVEKFRNYIYGKLLISELISFVSFIVLFILLTILSLQRRKSVK